MITPFRFSALAIAAFGLGLGAFAGTAAHASQLVYQPINPAFGGDPFAGSFLLETANMQNRHVRQPQFPDFDFDFTDMIVIGIPGTTPPENGEAETMVDQVNP